MTNTLYPYKHIAPTISNDFDEDMKFLLKNHATPEQILEYYIRALRDKERNTGKKVQVSAQEKQVYVGTAFKSLTVDEQHSRFITMEHVWKATSPFDFLTKYDAYWLSHTEYKGLSLGLEAGIDNGIVYQLFSRFAGQKKHILLINPHPSFLGLAVDFKGNITVSYTDDRFTEACSFQKKQNCKFTLLKDTPGKEKYDFVLFFCRNASTEGIVSNMNIIKPHLQDQDTQVYMQMASAHMDQKQSGQVFRKMIQESFTIQKVILIDPSAEAYPKKKRCIVTLKNKPVTGYHDVVMQKMRFVKEKNEAYLESQASHYVKHDKIMSETKTLRSMYDALPDSREIKHRATPKPLEFSPEITHIWISSAPKRAGAVRPVFNVFDYPTTDQIRKNRLARGEKLMKPRNGPRMDYEEVLAYAEKLLMGDERVYNTIRCSVLKKYRDKPISVKTVWFLYYEELQKLEGYDSKICNTLFRNTDYKECPISSLKIGEASKEDISEAVAEYAKNSNLSESQEGYLWNQVLLFWEIACLHKHTDSNPIGEMLDKRRLPKSKKQETRNALALNSHGNKSTQELMHSVSSETATSPCAIGVLIMLFLGMLAGEICALKWKDMSNVVNYTFYHLQITKKFPYSSKIAIPLSKKWQYRCLSVVRVLEAILLKHKRNTIALLKAQGKVDTEINDCPIVYDGLDPTKPITPHKLNEYYKSVISSLNIPELNVNVPIPNGESEQTDLNKSHSNVLRSNFATRMIHDAQLDADELAYLQGNSPATVMGKHYTGYSAPDCQLELLQKMERWIIEAQGTEHPKRNTKFFKFSQNADIVSQPESYPTEIVMEIEVKENSEKGPRIDFTALFGADVIIEKVEEVS